jgi:hypothetical protein
MALALVAANAVIAAADRMPIRGFSIEASFKLMQVTQCGEIRMNAS